MTPVLLTDSLRQTTVISFLQNRLGELGIKDSTLEPSLYSLANQVVKLVESHFVCKPLFLSEEDSYYDEVCYEFNNLVSQIQSLSLKGASFKTLVFVMTKILDQISREAKAEGNDTLRGIVFSTESKLLHLLVNYQEPA